MKDKFQTRRLGVRDSEWREFASLARGAGLSRGECLSSLVFWGGAWSRLLGEFHRSPEPTENIKKALLLVAKELDMRRKAEELVTKLAKENSNAQPD